MIRKVESEMIELEDAQQMLLSRARRLGAETVPILKSLGRVVREVVKSPQDIPPFNKSAMDGYAVRAVDVATARPAHKVELHVLEDVPAGHMPKQRVRLNTAIRIMTGAPMPEGADAVVMVEDTEPAEAENTIYIFKAVDRGENVGLAGEDVKKGTRVLKPGVIISPAHMGMLASMDCPKVMVSVKPRVAVISTGDELVEPGKTLGPGQIRDANGYALCGQADSIGAQARFLGIAKDKPVAVEAKLKRAQDFDVVLLSGGVSIGDYDFIQKVLLGKGVKQIFWRTAIKPGKPTFAGIKGRQFIFGLPGNPVSSMVTFNLFVRLVIDSMLGKIDKGLTPGRAVLEESISLKPGRRQFLRASSRTEKGRPFVQAYPNQKSGVLSSMVAANVLIDVPADTKSHKKGTEVDILLL